MIGTVEVQRNRLDTRRIIGRLREISLFHHLCQNHITTFGTTFGISHRIEERRVLTHSYQCGRLFQGQFFRFLIKISIRGRLDTHRIMQEIKVVQIHCNDFLFREITFQLNGDHPFDGFLEDTLQCALRFLCIELLGQLLRNRTTTTCTGLSHQSAFHDGTTERDEVYSRMLIETLILCGNESTHQIWRELVIINHDTILA